MRKFFNLFFNRIAFIGLFFVIQLGLLLLILLEFESDSSIIYVIFEILAVFVMLNIINNKSNPAYKIAWLIPVLVFPVFGAMLYILYSGKGIPKKQRKRGRILTQKYRDAMRSVPSAITEIAELDENAARQAQYLESCATATSFKKTESKYLKTGEIMFEAILEEIKKAEKFIFVQYFIIEEGKMWNTVLDILEEKVKSGVDVRVLYDDFGCILKLPKDYYKALRKKGIKCHVVNRINPVFSSKFNNRDHRKILVIDGNVAFTGGVNMADEYINAVERFGHWLDSGIMLRGAAVRGFTVMFLSTWDYIDNINEDFEPFMPNPEFVDTCADDGYIVPYEDIPADNEYVGKTVYLNMINRAKRYIYFCTPYLVIDNELITALTSAAKSGIDVRIMTPHIPDKKVVFTMTRSYYSVLIEAGVKIYEYTPGFLHSKSCVCDDEYAVCGSINLDFRSLYLHYECAVWLYKSTTVMDMKTDYLETLEKCEELTIEWCNNIPWYRRVWSAVLRAFAPLV